LFLAIAVLVGLQPFQAAGDDPSSAATYSHGLLQLTIPYHAHRNGAGQLTIEILDPEDKVLGQAERHIQIVAGHGQWRQFEGKGGLAYQVVGSYFLPWDRNPRTSLSPSTWHTIAPS
jgi:hypothetical protein